LKNNLPLSKYTVLDLTIARAGPTAARVLADWGANVIQINPPNKPGQKGGSITGKRDGFDFQNLQRNKRGLTLDLKNPEGHALFLKMASKADVILENFRADVKHRLKIDYDTIKKTNKEIIYGSISGFGQEGPYKERPGLDQIIQGMSGLMSITGQPENGPMRVGIPINDLCAGMFLAQGVLLALLNRENTGKGQWVHTSLLESGIFMLDFQASRWLQNKQVAKQAGNNHPTGIPQGCFKTSDKLINVSAVGDRLFSRFCEAVDAHHLIENPKFFDDESRLANRDELNVIISKILIEHDSDHWINKLNKVGVPCGPVNDIAQMFGDEQVKELNMVRKVQHKRLGELDVVRQPLNFSDFVQPEQLEHPAPDLGQHTEEILTEFGIEEEVIKDLVKKEVI
jgi:formyl-CoA transferase|tara:strand:+ start:108 stop:1301 length:1194 start_codon:yes stop_codon:yes gene_type:complete